MTIFTLADVAAPGGLPSDYAILMELWEQADGYWVLSERGCEVAESLGCTIDVDAYGRAFARPPEPD